MLRRVSGGPYTHPFFMPTMSSSLFPTPSLPQSALTPSHFLGVSPDSTTALQNVLKDNHAKWHIFFNDQRFHNHAAHRAIAAWALGAGGPTIQSAYERDCGYERPAFKSPEEITMENFYAHLGDDRYFNSYMQFFTSYVKEKGVSASIENFIFSRKANYGTNTGKAELPKEKQPQMLSRFLNGVLHPMIHTGYGAEFTLPGMVIEGLAQTAVHFSSPVAELLEQLKLFEDSNRLLDSNFVASAGQTIRSAFDQTVNAFDSALDKALLESRRAPPGSISFSSTRGSTEVGQEVPNILEKSSANIGATHALTILSRVLNNSQFFASAAAADDENNMFEHTIRKHGKALADYVNQWHVTGEVVEKKIEELVWAVCVLYGVAGWTHSGLTEGKKFNADFFFMHLVTSSIFLPALCAVLPPESQARLLKAYFATALAWTVARGRPSLDVKGFVKALQNPKFSSAPSSAPTWESTWLRMVEEARTHHDEHLTKTIRALAGWASAFGTRKSRAKLLSSIPRSIEKVLTEDETYGAGLGMGLGGPNDSTGATDFLQSDVPASEDNYSEVKNSPGSDADENVLPQTELPGSEYLDGRLFEMVAILTLNRMGWELDEKKEKEKRDKREGQTDEEEFWDFVGFFAPDVSPRL